jgi:hypothetical protein
VLDVRALGLLPLLLAACAIIPGNYETPPAIGARHVRVTLKPDGFGAVSSSLAGSASRFLAEGTWVEEGGRIRLKVEKQTLVFQRRGDELVAREWDRGLWGEDGPGVLVKVR